MKEGNYSLQLDKTPHRSYPEHIQERIRYPKASIRVGKLLGNRVELLPGVASLDRTLFGRYILQKGVYIVMAQIDYDRQLEKDFDVNLAVYAEYACKVELASHQEAVALAGR